MRSVLAATTALVVMLLPMSGCADDPTGDDRPDPTSAGGGLGPGTRLDVSAIEGAVAATRAVPSARVELATLYRGLGGVDDTPAGARDVRLVQRAAFDRRTGRASAESDMSELAAVVEAADRDVAGDYSRPASVVVDGDTMYAQLGPMAEAIGLEPTTWVERDVADLGDEQLDNETMALLLEPFGMLDLLALPLEAVHVVGPDEVRGTAATRVEATVDLGRVAARAEAAEDAERSGAGVGDEGDPEAEAPIDPGDAALVERFRRLGLSELPVELWLDDDRLVRRLAFSVGRHGAAASSPGTLTTTFDIYDVGTPIDVVIPSGPDVIDQAELRARVTG